VYAITDAGRAELDARSGELDGIESELTDSVRRLADEVRASVSDAMKTLRADLAAAAREAREESGVRTAGAGDGARAASRARLHEADAAIAEFRADVRTELRTTAAGGVLEQHVVDLLVAGLRSVRRDVIAALRQ